MTTTRFTVALGSGSLMPATLALVALEGSRNSQVVVVKTEAFEFIDICAPESVGSVLVGRTGTVAGSARTVIGLVVPLTVIDGQTR